MEPNGQRFFSSNLAFLSESNIAHLIKNNYPNNRYFYEQQKTSSSFSNRGESGIYRENLDS